MIRTPFRSRVIADNVDSDLSDADFAAESEANRTLMRRGIGAFLVSLLGLGVMAGVSMAAAQNSSRQASSSIVVDSAAPDNTKAEPQNSSKTAEEKSAQQSQGNAGNVYSDRTGAGNNTVKNKLNQKVQAGEADKRNTELDQSEKSVVVAANNAAMEGRYAKLDSDIAKAKAKAAEYAAERRKAEKRLAEQKALIAKLKAKRQAGTASASELAQLAVLEALPEGAVNQVSTGGGILPIAPGSFRLNAGFGAVGSWARYHTGQDFVAACGTPIRAVAAGVIAADPPAGWAGIHVAVIHANGGTTMYSHLSSRVVRQGQIVKAGDVIGYVGSTGRSFGCHLHFEYYPPGTSPGDVYSATNPLVFLRRLGVKI